MRSLGGSKVFRPGHPEDEARERELEEKQRQLEETQRQREEKKRTLAGGGEEPAAKRKKATGGSKRPTTDPGQALSKRRKGLLQYILEKHRRRKGQQPGEGMRTRQDGLHA